MLQSRTRFALALLAATCLTPIAPARAAPGDPVGEEFRVNSFTGGSQGGEVVAMNADGDFVVVWSSFGQDVPSSSVNGGIFAQRYNAAGEPQGDEFRVNAVAEERQRRPSVAMDADGNFVVTWINGPEGGGGNHVLLGQRYNAAGERQGSEFQLNTSMVYHLTNNALAMDADGNFVAIWRSSGRTTGRVFNAAGEPQGSEFIANTNTVSERDLSRDVGMIAKGDFVVVWDEDCCDHDVFAQRYNAAGEPQGGNFMVNTFSEGSQRYPAVAVDADGDFVVAWSGIGDGDGWGIFAQHFDAAGVPQGTEFQVNTVTAGTQLYPSIAMASDGDFVVTWSKYHDTRRSSGVFARRYDANGEPQGEEIRVSSDHHSGHLAPAAMDADGDFAVTWSPIYIGVFARRFQGEGHIDGDFDSDGRADILWRNSVTDDNVIWRMAGFERLETGSIGAAYTQWRVAGIADFTGDYMADVLWRNADTNNIALWQMNGFDKMATGSIGHVTAVWRIRGLGDFNGDGHADILWRHTGHDNARIWQMNGFVREASEPIGAVARPWEVAGVGDFDGDAKADILWRNADTGVTVVWRMDGFTKLAAQSIGAPQASWRIADIGDFNADGKADILWRNAETGNTIIWQMDGFTKIAQTSIGVVDAAWTVVQLRDTNGDDRADILWRNPGTGNTRLWQMDGFEKIDAQSVGTPSTSWQVQ